MDFRRWSPQAEKRREEPGSIACPCPSPLRGSLTCAGRHPGRQHSAGVSVEGQELSPKLSEEQKEGDGLSLSTLLCFSVGSWSRIWQKSEEDIIQFLRCKLNPQSLNCGWCL